MRYWPMISGAMLGLLAASAGHAEGDALAQKFAGRWQTETRHGVVEVTPCGAGICGRLIDSDGLRANPALRDVHNKDATRRERPLKGLLILQGFHRSGDGWSGGTVYNGEDGGTYSGTVTPVDAAHLKVRGCIVWPLCKSQTWTRIG